MDCHSGFSFQFISPDSIGGDQLGFFLVGFYSLSFVCWCIFLSFSFLLGYKAGGGAIIAVPVLVLIAGIYLWQSFGSWNEPGTLWWQAGNVALFFTVLFSVGLLCKYGIKTGGIIRVGAVVVTVITVFVSIMISLSNLCGAYSPLPEELFWKDAYPEKTPTARSISTIKRSSSTRLIQG